MAIARVPEQWNLQLQTTTAKGQRIWNLQQDGGFAGLGISVSRSTGRPTVLLQCRIR